MRRRARLSSARSNTYTGSSRELSSKATRAMKRSAVNDSAVGSAQLRTAAGRLEPMTCWACEDRTSAPGSTSQVSPATTAPLVGSYDALGVFAAHACIAAREAKCRRVLTRGVRPNRLFEKSYRNRNILSGLWSPDNIFGQNHRDLEKILPIFKTGYTQLFQP